MFKLETNKLQVTKSKPKTLRICIDGNIGSGKSTVLQLFIFIAASCGISCKIVEEPVDKWANFSGENQLQKFYQDSKTHAYQFQTLVLLTMLENHVQFNKDYTNMKNGICIMERSIYSAVYVFIKELV